MEFEQGIPPPNPWDQPETLAEDMKALDSILNAPKRNSLSSSSAKQNIPIERRSIDDEFLAFSVSEKKPPLPKKPTDIKSKIINMGYSEQAAAVAIKVFGEAADDTARPLKFAAFFDKVKSKKYMVDDVIMAFVLFENNSNSEKAVCYLKDFAELKEFGFPSNRIQDALVNNNFDKNAALDFLMGP